MLDYHYALKENAWVFHNGAWSAWQDIVLTNPVNAMLKCPVCKGTFAGQCRLQFNHDKKILEGTHNCGAPIAIYSRKDK